jgi:3-phenylpropionate/trans-cinnamate dioxygenase ferredoxin reductase subunit
MRRQVETIVIVGAGQAGAQAAFTLREHGHAGPLILLGDEPQPPYQRPPLSKKFLANSLSVERVLLRPHAYYAEHSIDLRLHERVEGIDRRRRRVVLRGGRSLPYDKLLLATGSRPRRLNIPGARANDVHYLHSLQDALSLRRKLLPGTRLAIIGGGYIGLEIAATARAAGLEVTVFERDERPMKRVTTDRVSDFFAAAHRANGVEIRCAAEVQRFDAGERLESVIVDGERWPADIAVVGIGADPNVELASQSGIDCIDGIAVDEHCRTADPAIYAAGDCTNHPNAYFQSRMRLECVQNAIDQGTHAALNMLGMATPYRQIPWFWTHQYQYKLQSAGVCTPCDDIEMRGDVASGRFAFVYRNRGVLTGVDAVNLPREYMEMRRKLEEERQGTTSQPTKAAASSHTVGAPVSACLS